MLWLLLVNGFTEFVPLVFPPPWDPEADWR